MTGGEGNTAGGVVASISGGSNNSAVGTAASVVGGSHESALSDDSVSLGELSELESLRLQMAMDRLSKFEATLSNILQSISDIETRIIANMQ